MIRCISTVRNFTASPLINENDPKCWQSNKSGIPYPITDILYVEEEAFNKKVIR
jgi:hypothetical protein